MYRARYLRDPGPLPQRVRELRNVLELRNVSLELRNVSLEGNSKISERPRPALPPSEFDTRFNVYSWGGKVYTRLSAQVQTASPRKCRHLGPNCRPTELTKGSELMMMRCCGVRWWLCTCLLAGLPADVGCRARGCARTGGTHHTGRAESTLG